MSEPSSNSTVTTDNPGMDWERMRSTPEAPSSAFSIGCDTSDSTSSGDSPAASVWITTWVGENSGNTSSRACSRVNMP
jgi:hypothetical protein